MQPAIRTARLTGWFQRSWIVALLGPVLLMGPANSLVEARRFQDEPKDPPKPKAEAGAVEARFADNSVLKLTLREEKIEIVTPYGKLLIPVADIQHIDFATRVSEADTKRIPVLIGNLGSADFPVRDAASEELLKLAEKAYPALVEAEKSKDPEVARRVAELLEKIRDTVPKENLEIRPFDVIQTENSKISGRISATTLKATTSQFGDVTVKLVDVRSLRAPGFVEPEKEIVNAEPAPQNLFGLQNQIGKTFNFTVTGANNGGVWGTFVYTLDSNLQTAAVHAGALKIGQTGVVKVKIVVPPNAFQGTQRNGIQSGNYGAYQGAFQIISK